MKLGNKINAAISCIRLHEPDEGYWVSFSGGKDSIVAYDLVKRAGVKYDVHFNQTTIDPPEIYQFIRANYPEVIWEKPKRSMFAAIRARQIPPHAARSILLRGTKRTAWVQPRDDYWSEAAGKFREKKTRGIRLKPPQQYNDVLQSYRIVVGTRRLGLYQDVQSEIPLSI